MKAIYTKLPRWRYAGTNTTDRYALKNVARSPVCWLSSSSSGESNNNETSKASWRNSNWRSNRTSPTRLGERMMNDTPITHPQQQSNNSSKNTLRQIEESAFENMSKSLSDTMRVKVKPRASNQVQHQQRRPPPPSIHNNRNDNRNYNLNYRKNLNHLKVGTNVNPHDDPQIIKALTKINNCKEIQHVLRVLKDYNSDYSRDVEGSNSLVPAAWKKIQSLLKDTNNQRGGRHQQSTTSHQQQQQNTSAVRYELEELFHKTLSELHTYNPNQLSDISQSTAHIVKHVTNRSNKSSLEGATLYNLFATKNSQTINYWNTILQLTIQEIDKYTPKQLVTISWTYATILQNRGNHTNDRSMLYNVVNVTPYFNALHASYKKRSEEFKLKHLGNILWSCMTCKVSSVPQIYTDFANEFIQRREKESKQLQKYDRINNNNDRLDPIILCQWVNGYAKSNESPNNYEKLFECISHVAIPMMLDDKFDSRHYANFVYAYALAKFNPRYSNNNNNNNSVNSNNQDGSGGSSSTPESTTLYDTVAKSIIPKLSTFSPQHLANISWSFAKMEHFSSSDMFHAIAEESKHRLKEFTPQQLANLTWAFSKFPSSSTNYGDLYNYIASDIINNRNGTSRFSSQGLAMLCTSFASVQQKKNDDSHTKFWDLLENDASSQQRLKQFGPIECSQISWSFATIGRSQSDQLFTGIEHVVLSKIGVGKFETLGLSNLAWSFSILGYGSSNFFTVIEKQCIDKFNECTAKDKTMLALAYSRREGDDNDNEEYPKELFDLIASSSLTSLQDYTGLDLFNIVVSFVKVGYIHKPLMEAVANELVRRPLSEFSYQDRDVVNACVGLAWAYSTVGCRSPRLLDYIATACIDKLDTLDTKEIGSLAWSFASLECYHRPFFRALTKSSEHRWDEFDESSLAKMAWALSTKSLNIPDCGDDDDSLIVEKIYMSEITKAAIAKCDTFTVQAISMLLWSCSARGYLHPQLFETFIPRASDLLLDASGELDDIHISNIQSLANIAWACSVQDIVDADTLFGDAFISIITWHIDEFDNQGLCQLHQWNTWRKTLDHSATLPQDIEERCRDTFINRGVRSSNLQKDVIFELSRMGMQLEDEALTSSGYRLDVVVNIDGKQIGIEVDGPTHFIDKEPTGSTMLKQRQVVNCDGIELVSIPYWEWNELKSSNDKERYLRDRLNTCGEGEVRF